MTLRPDDSGLSLHAAWYEHWKRMALRIEEGKDPAEFTVAKMVAALYFTTMRRVIRSQSALYGAC